MSLPVDARVATVVTTAIFALLPAPGALAAQELPPPILDVHLHALRATDQGPPPLGFCMADAEWSGILTGSATGASFLRAMKSPDCPDPVWSPETDEELMERTLAVMERRRCTSASASSATGSPARNSIGTSGASSRPASESA